MTTVDELRAAVAAVRGEVVEVSGVRTGFPMMSVRVKDNTSAIQLINELASRDAGHADVAELAYLIRGSARDPLSSAQAVQAFMQRVPFILEKREKFQHPLYTVRWGGDCDDHARAAVAFNRSLGIDAWCEPTFSPHDEQIRHVAPRVAIAGVPRWGESTCAAHWDEHPRAAGLRLGLIREDLGSLWAP